MGIWGQRPLTSIHEMSLRTVCIENFNQMWEAYAGAFYCLAHLSYQFLHSRYVP